MTRIEYLVAHPYEVEKSDIPLLKKEVEKYPYFYTLRALLLYGLKKENHPSFEDYLNKTSIHSSNRVDLYHYLNSEQIEKEVIINRNEMLLDENPILDIEEPFVVTEESKEDIAIENKTEEIVEDVISEKLEENNKIIIEDEFQEIEIPDTEETEIHIENAIQQTSKIELQEHIIETNITPEEEIKIENVDISSTHSFSDWLKRFPSQQKDQKMLEEEQEIADREIKYKLIDDFLEKNPKIIPMKKTDISPANSTSNFVKNSEEYSDLMTETLAQIYIEQKKYDKAIKAYKILILKYPEKNGLFANRIKEIENLKNSK